MGGERKEVQSQFSRVSSLGYKFYRLAHLFARTLDERLVKHGVSVGQFRVLLVLWESEDLTQVEIARYLNIEQPTVAITLKRMERDGLIKTMPDPLDGRRTRIVLTERGQMLKEPLTAEAHYINEVAVKGLSADEITQLHNLLDRLTNTFTTSDP